MKYDDMTITEPIDVLFAEREMLVSLGEDPATVRELPSELLNALYPEYLILSPQLRYQIFKAEERLPMTGEAMKLIYFIVASNEKNYGRHYARTETLAQIPFLRNMEPVVSSCNELSSMVYSNHLKTGGGYFTELTKDLKAFSKTIADFLPRRPNFRNRAENEAFAAAMLLCMNPHVMNCYSESIRNYAESLQPQFAYILKNFEGFVIHKNRKGSHE